MPVQLITQLVRFVLQSDTTSPNFSTVCLNQTNLNFSRLLSTPTSRYTAIKDKQHCMITTSSPSCDSLRTQLPSYLSYKIRTKAQTVAYNHLTVQNAHEYFTSFPQRLQTETFMTFTAHGLQSLEVCSLLEPHN